MRRVRPQQLQDQARPGAIAPQAALPLDDGTGTTPVTLAMSQALIPLGLRAVEDALQTEVTCECRKRAAGRGTVSPVHKKGRHEPCDGRGDHKDHERDHGAMVLEQR